MALTRGIYELEHTQFRDSVREFVQRVSVPNTERWKREGIVDRWVFTEAAKAGLLGFALPEEYGGGGTTDFRFNAIMAEELATHPGSDGLGGIALQNDIVFPYFVELATEEQRERWLPGIAAGELVTAIAMTEPGTGSDLAGIQTRAVRDGDDFLVNGSKTFISNGQNADLIITAVRTGEDPHRGISLIVIEGDRPGLTRGRNLDKIGQSAQDTSELSFVDVRVPAANLLGDEGGGFFGLMRNLPQERLSIAVGAVAASEGVLARALEYAQQRTAFGRAIGSFQHNRFLLAEMTTEIQAARTYVDACITEHLAGTLSVEDAAGAKWWTTEQLVSVTNRCLQLYGGYGYMREYQIAQDYLDARVTTIYGGTTEIMKEIVGRSLGL